MTTTASSTTSPDSLRHSPDRTRPANNDRGWARAAAAAGIAFVVLNVAGTFAPGAPPASDATAAKIAKYFADHRGAIKAQLLLGGLGIAALMWWFGALWRTLSRAEEERPRLAIVAAVSLGAGLTLALMNGVFNATAAIRPVDADTTRLFYSLSLVVIAAAGFGIGLFLIAASAVTYRTRITPTWVSYLGWLAGLAFFGSTLGAVTDSNVVNLLGLLAFFVWCAWIVSVSVIMWRGTPRRG